jgi:acetyltransferase-like isoleucine patch superfamily enzyme
MKPNKTVVAGAKAEFRTILKLSFISFFANHLLFGDGVAFNRARARFLSWYFDINNKAFIGKNVKILPGKGAGLRDLHIGYRGHIYRGCDIITPLILGDGSYINRYSLIANTAIGKNCAIGPGVIIGCTTHKIGSSNRRADKGKFLPVKIEDGVWIGARAVILGGVRVGRGSIVAAGAVVTRDVQPNTMVGGVPAKLIRYLN